MHLCFCSDACNITVKDLVGQKNRRLALKLTLFAVGMIGFCIALIPLYDVLTDMSGINGKLAAPGKDESLHFTVDQTRVINVDLITSVGKGAALTFAADTQKMQIHPGQVYDIHYTAKNTANKVIKVHASPSVSPGLVATQFKLIVCFCFEDQTFEAGEVKHLSLRFVIDPTLPVQYKNIALAQQFFNTK